MKNFFSKIKSGIGNVLTSIKKAFVNLKDKIKNTFNKIRNRNKQNQENIEIGNESVVPDENIKGISNERQTIVKDNTVPMNSNTKFRTMGHDTVVAPIVVNKTQNNTTPQRETSNITNQDYENYSQEEDIDSTIGTENAERIVSIDIKENIGIVEFETITGKKYQKNIDDILNEKKNVYKNWNINKKCNDFAKNKIQALRLRRRLNPIVISTLNNEEDIDNYIKCVRDIEKIWFNLEHDLTNSKLKGENARLMRRAGKHEEKIGAKVKRKESLIERMLKKIKEKNKEPEEMAEEVEEIEKDNNELNGIEAEIIEDINQVEDKKSKKEEKLAKKEEEKLAKKEFKERHTSYATLIGKLYGLEPRKKLDEIMNDVVDRDLYNLTDKDAWTRAVATFNVGHKLAMIKPNEAKNYLVSAYDQFNNEELLAKSENAFQYLEDTLLNLQELYIREGNYNEATKLNGEYMRIVEREKKETINPMILESRKNGSQIKEIDLMIEYRKKYVAGQKAAMKILYRAGHKFEAEELYRKILNESGIVLTDEAYDLSIKENCIENGKYIVIDNGITYREPILGNEKYLVLRNKLTQQLIKNKMNNGTIVQPKTEPTSTETKVEPKIETVQPTTKVEPKVKTVQPTTKIESKVETVQPVTKVKPKAEPVPTETKVEPKIETVQPATRAETKTEIVQPTTKVEPKVETIQPVTKVKPKVETVQPVTKVEPKVETVQPVTKVEQKLETEQTEINTELNAEPIQPEVKNETKAKSTQSEVQVELKPAEDTKKKGKIAKKIDSIAKQMAEKAKERADREEQIRKQREEQRKREEEEKKKLEEERKQKKKEEN